MVNTRHNKQGENNNSSSNKHNESKDSNSDKKNTSKRAREEEEVDLPIHNNINASRFLINATRANAMELARDYYPGLIHYLDDRMLEKCKLDYQAISRLDARHRFTEQTENNLLSLILVPPFAGSGSLHKELSRLVRMNDAAPFDGLNDRCIEIRKEKLKTMNELLREVDLFVDTCVGVNEKKTFAQHKLEHRNRMMCNLDKRKVQPIKCHVTSCPSIVPGEKRINTGSMFCVSCTTIYRCGEAYNGICSSKHCHSVHTLIENVKTVIAAKVVSNDEDSGIDDL